MFADVSRSRLLVTAATLPPLLVILFFATSEWNLWSESPLKLAATISRDDISLETMKESLAKDRKMLAHYEREQSALRAEVIRQRKLLHQDQSLKDQVSKVEKTFITALTRVHEMRRSVEETDVAITEAVLGKKVLRMPELPANGFSEATEFAHFNGRFKWSLKEAPRIEKYFSQAFGRRLPVTAMGQSDTHNRLGFNHHDAMDVGLNPRSPEGRALTDYLRRAGIPFIAFHGAVSGTSTGPHIHIGRPSGPIVRL